VQFIDRKGVTGTGTEHLHALNPATGPPPAVPRTAPRKYTGEAWVEKQTRPRVNVIVTPTHQHDYSE